MQQWNPSFIPVSIQTIPWKDEKNTCNDGLIPNNARLQQRNDDTIPAKKI
jgi:hypothetical protein